MRPKPLIATRVAVIASQTLSIDNRHFNRYM